MPKAKSVTELRDAIKARGLDFDAVARHGELLARSLREHTKPQFKILDTCRIGNGGIVPLAVSDAARGNQPGKHIAGFVPAAGAASRYSRPLADLIAALEAGDLQAFANGIAGLQAEGAASWPLPASVVHLIEQPKAALNLDDRAQAALLADMQLPKALLPCVTEGLSFLTLKHREHQRLAKTCGLAGQVFIVPPGYESTFASELNKQNPSNSMPTHYLPQGPALSTIRFDKQGCPITDERGDVSPVPAGHGTLARLFPEVKRLIPAATSVLIRNIDNVIGDGPAAIGATEALMGLHQIVLTAVVQIRTALNSAGGLDLAKAAKVAGSLIGHFGEHLPPPPAELGAIQDPDARCLWELQARVFHANLAATDLSTKALTALYARPVNTLGQVPNTGKDVGGTPCFVVMTTGTEKVCLEVPHASADDKKAFLEDPKRATHFNPVYVVAELVDPSAYARGDDQFWMMAEKTYKGDAVVYYETVLYELLGNSRLANSIFVEIPRLLFNPHKTLSDAMGRRASTWLTEK